MPADPATARDDIQSAFWTVWQADTTAVVGYVPTVQWPKVPFAEPDPLKVYARVHVQHNIGTQATLAGETGKKRWTRTGVVTISIFLPIADGKGLDTADKLAKIAKKAFEGVRTANGVWFRDVVPKEVGETGAWYQINVLAEFRYDEFI